MAGLRDHLGCWELELGQQHARQALSTLYYYAGPSQELYLKKEKKIMEKKHILNLHGCDAERRKRNHLAIPMDALTYALSFVVWHGEAPSSALFP